MADNPHRWYMLLGGEREGPLTASDIRYLLIKKKIDGGTLVWRKGMDTWKRLREMEEFRGSKSEQPQEPEAGGEPPPAHPAPGPPVPETAVAGGLPFALKLTAFLMALGLISGGIYWAVHRGAPQSPDPAGHAMADPEVRRLVDQLRTGDNPQTEAALSDMGSRAVPELMRALEAGLELAEIPPVRVRRVLVGMGPAAIAPLMVLLRGDETGVPVRIFVIQVLGGIGGPLAVPGLVEALDDASPAVQSRAVVALAGLGPEATPVMANQLSGPVHALPPQARKNLVQAIGQRADPAAAPTLRRMQALEKHPEVQQALAQALNRISEGRRETPGATPSGAGPMAAAPPARPMENAPPAPPPVNVRVHASAEARVSVTGDDAEKGGDEEKQERDPEAAREHAGRGAKHREQGEPGAALAEYRQAYRLNPLQVYYLIIVELEAALPDSARRDTPSSTEVETPPVVVALEEIHAALSAPHPNLDPYGNALGIWRGRLDVPLGWDAGREQFLVLGEDEGLNFVASLPAGKRRSLNLQAGVPRLWRGKLQGIKVVRQEGSARVLPVLLVNSVE